MDLYVARQPIFDAKLEVYGYELLYRRSMENRFQETDADEASSHVMINSFTVLGMDTLTGGRRAFVNFTERLLRDQVATLFPRDILVVEVLEDIVPDPDLLEACKRLHEAGYLIALDDFLYVPAIQPFLPLADIIKVDFTLTKGAERGAVVRRFGNGKTRFLAEKVETREEFEQAKAFGYTLFQGFFFAKPIIQPMGDVPPIRMNQLRLLEMIQQPEFEYEGLTRIVSQDVSLSYKLLKLVNASVFGRRFRIDSVRHALVTLGMKEIRKWLSLLLMRGICHRKPDELVRLSLIRAKMLEAFGKQMGMKRETEDLFLMGLFSCLDVMMDRPLEELLEGLGVHPAVREGLLRMEGTYGFLYQLVLAYEKGDWETLARQAALLGLDPSTAPAAYVESLGWCAEILTET